MKRIIIGIGWGLLSLLVVAIVRYTIAGDTTRFSPKRTISQNELFLMAHEGCPSQSASTLGLEKNDPIVINYCGCYATEVASKYKGITFQELSTHIEDFKEIGARCATDVFTRYQYNGGTKWHN